jgi:hypothetical protein
LTKTGQEKQEMNNDASLIDAARRALEAAYPEAAPDARAAVATELLAAGALGFDSSAQLRSFNNALVEQHAPRLVAALNGNPVRGWSDDAKIARSLQRERELAPLPRAKPAQAMTLQEALAAIPGLPANATEHAKITRSMEVERAMRAYGHFDGDDAA